MKHVTLFKSPLGDFKIDVEIDDDSYAPPPIKVLRFNYETKHIRLSMVETARLKQFLTTAPEPYFVIADVHFERTSENEHRISFPKQNIKAMCTTMAEVFITNRDLDSLVNCLELL